MFLSIGPLLIVFKENYNILKVVSFYDQFWYPRKMEITRSKIDFNISQFYVGNFPKKCWNFIKSTL